MSSLKTSLILRVGQLLTAVLLACLSLAGQVQAQSRYSYSNDGSEVTDAKTGLVWQRCSQLQRWSGTTCVDNGGGFGITQEMALVLAKKQAGWRVPNVKELSSLVDVSRTSPAIDTTAFPNVPPWPFWSSTGYAGHDMLRNDAWFVNFSDGSVSNNSRNWAIDVRLVR